MLESGGVYYFGGALDLKQAYPRHMKVALLVAVLAVSALMALYKAGEIMALKRAEAEARRRAAVTKVVFLTPSQLGPPPSLSGQSAPAQVTPTAAAAAAPTVGVPVPVPDAEATVATGATQAQLAVLPGSEGAGLAGAESVAVVPEDIIPRPEDFVAYDSPPQPIALAKPEYPPIARQAGVEGRVFVQLLLDLDGDVMDARVAKSSGNAALDEAAVEAGKKCKFTPAKQRDKPVRVWVVFPFNFSLRNP